jgi:hypothetical protein
MSDIGEVAGAVSSVSNLVDGILTRADRDAPDKEQHEYIVKIQNAFADNTLDSDEFRCFIDELCNKTGSAITPTRDPGTGRRELLHALLVNTVALIHERRLTAKLISKLIK